MNDTRPQIDYARTMQDGRALTSAETQQLKTLHMRKYGDTYQPHVVRDGLEYAYLDRPSPLEALTHPSGLLGALVDYGAAQSLRRTRVPALAGALAAVSALSGGKFVTEGFGKLTSLGLQTMVVAESGVGKDIMYSTIHEVERHAPEAFNTAHPVSPAGLHQALLENKALLWPVDEFGRYLDAATKEAGHDYAVLTKMMELHTGFLKVWNERTYSDAKSKKEAIAHPLLAGAYATTPGRFLKAMDKGTVVDGLLGRMLVFNMTDPVAARPLKEMENRVHLSPDAQGAIASVATLWHAMNSGIRGIGDNWFHPIRFTPEARGMLQATFDDVDPRGQNEIERTLWRRAFEQVIRISGVVALSDAAMTGMPTSAMITASNLNWAKAVVVACAESMMADVVANAAETDFERLQNGIMKAVRKLGKGGWARQSNVILQVKGRARSYMEVKDAAQILVDAGLLEIRLHKTLTGQEVVELRVIGA